MDLTELLKLASASNQTNEEANSARAGKRIVLHDLINISDEEMTTPSSSEFEPKAYYLLNLVEKNAPLGAQSKAYVKAVFEDTHSTIFQTIQRLMEKHSNDKDAVMDEINKRGVEGSQITHHWEEPYYVKNGAEYLINPSTKEKALAYKSVAFLFSDEDVQTSERTARRRLEFVKTSQQAQNLSTPDDAEDLVNPPKGEEKPK